MSSLVDILTRDKPGLLYLGRVEEAVSLLEDHLTDMNIDVFASKWEQSNYCTFIIASVLSVTNRT